MKCRKIIYIGGPYDGICKDMFAMDVVNFPPKLCLLKHPNMIPSLGSISRAVKGFFSGEQIIYNYSCVDPEGRVVYKLEKI